MTEIQILDCTLRDGGYCNQWRFGKENIRKIVDGLVQTGIDVIECGFLTNKIKDFDENISRFSHISYLNDLIPIQKSSSFVLMVNYGEYPIENLPNCVDTCLDGIRVAFHKKDKDEALEYCKKVKAKGYNVYIQPMVSLSYTDDEFIDLIKKSNDLEPYAFYIVDSFGNMKCNELIHMFCMIENNLSANIFVGFHSHNNMQLAYSNAQTLVNIQSDRKLLIDASVYGMGRGAGNLNTELFTEYLNENYGRTYKRRHLLTIIDQILSEIYQKNSWGYTLPNYLSAVHNAHPNYASYLDDKKTLTVESMNEIFSMMNDNRKNEFDKEYIKSLYRVYMTKNANMEFQCDEFKQIIKGKRILLVAPGKSSSIEKEKVINFINQEDVVSISINHEYPYVQSDYIFISNIRRYREIDIKQKENRCIITSNIGESKAYLKVQYENLLNDEEYVSDNAGLMLIQLMIQLGVESIYLAGFDGYTHDVHENYANVQLEMVLKNDMLDKMNNGMCNVINKQSEISNIIFLTKTKYICTNRNEE